jgi:hypothetical protein
MARYYGATLLLFDDLSGEAALQIARRMLSATNSVWGLVDGPADVLEKHRREVAAFEKETKYIVDNPIPGDLWDRRNNESAADWRQRWNDFNYPTPFIYFSPLSAECLYGFPNSRLYAYPPPGNYCWPRDVTIQISSKFQIDDEEPEDIDWLKEAGVWGVPVVPFAVGQVPFETTAQREVFEYLCNEFDQRKDQYQSEDRWQFNSRALAYIISAVWSTLPVEELKVIYPGYDD